MELSPLARTAAQHTRRGDTTRRNSVREPPRIEPQCISRLFFHACAHDLFSAERSLLSVPASAFLVCGASREMKRDGCNSRRPRLECDIAVASGAFTTTAPTSSWTPRCRQQVKPHTYCLRGRRAKETRSSLVEHPSSNTTSRLRAEFALAAVRAACGRNAGSATRAAMQRLRACEEREAPKKLQKARSKLTTTTFQTSQDP